MIHLKHLLNERTSDPQFTKKEALALLKSMVNGEDVEDEMSYLGYLTRDAFGTPGELITKLFDQFNDLNDALMQQDMMNVKNHYKIIKAIVNRLPVTEQSTEIQFGSKSYYVDRALMDKPGDGKVFAFDDPEMTKNSNHPTKGGTLMFRKSDIEDKLKEQSTRSFKDTGSPNWQHTDQGNEFPVPGEILIAKDPEIGFNEQDNGWTREMSREDIINLMTGLHPELGLEFLEWANKDGFDSINIVASKKMIGQWLDAIKTKSSNKPKLDDEAKLLWSAMGRYVTAELSSSDRDRLMKKGEQTTRVSN